MLLLFFTGTIPVVWTVTAPNTGIWTEVSPAEGTVG